MRTAARLTYRFARRVVIGMIGGTVLLAGTVMLVTPGPGLVVIPSGLAILAIEFAWARRWLRKVRERISGSASQARAARISARRPD